MIYESFVCLCISYCISQFQLRPAPLPPPRAAAGHLPAFSVPGVDNMQIFRSQGPGICQPQGYSRAFDMHSVSYQNKTTKRILLKKAD